MSSTVLFNLLRVGRSSVTRQTFLSARCSAETSTAPAQVGGALFGVVGVRHASGSVRFDSDGSGRPVTWDSFGIWGNRIEEPILLPSSIKYGKPIPQVSLSRVGSASVLGLRKQNEDRLRIARIHDNLLYFAVFDGHGGPHAADYCYTFMEKFIRDALEDEDDLEKVLKKAFLDVDSALYTHLSYFNNASFLTAGTTATVAMLRDGVELVVGSVGDSPAMLCRKGQAAKLTKDHTPDRKDERKRIQKFGGFVTWNSVGQANVNGRLAMTRSIGDFHLKTNGVIAEPDTRRLTVQHTSDSFLALTTDGINFLLSDQEICDVINQCQDPTEAAEVIAEQALQYGSEDNSTIIIVPLGAWGKHQSSNAVYSMSRNFSSSGRWAIQKFGGFVTWNSVGQANVNGRLAMTRSIGDFHLKTNGVIAEPDTRRLKVQHTSDSFLALTTDSINFLLSDQEICDVINQCQDPTEAAEVIAEQALQYGSEDNSTIIIVPLGAWGKHQSSNAVYSMSRNFSSSGRWA